MKVLTLHQPYATLIALGVKWIETRPQAWRSLIGQRIAIHAAAKRPTPESLSMWAALLPVSAPIDAPDPDPADVDRDPWLYWRDDDVETAFGRYDWTSANTVKVALPLGAIVCTAVVTDSLPMGARMRPTRLYGFDLPETRRWIDVFLASPRAELVDWDVVGDGRRVDISDQLPYGDFRPGRFGLLLDDIRVLPEPVPFKGGQGLSRSWEPA